MSSSSFHHLTETVKSAGKLGDIDAVIKALKDHVGEKLDVKKVQRLAYEFRACTHYKGGKEIDDVKVLLHNIALEQPLIGEAIEKGKMLH